ncbi:hypothetical protein ES703_64469 [subsurface metagenome]
MSLLIPTRAITDANANYPRGYHRGNVGGLPAVEPDLIVDNIKLGITMFGIPGTMGRWIYDLSFPELAKLVIPTPSIALVAAEDHSGGGHTATPTLTIPPPPTISISQLALFDQRYEDDADSDFSIYSNFWEAQTFTTLQAHNIEILEKLCRYVGSPATIGNITIGIKNTVADLPSGGDLTSVTFAASDLPASNDWLVKLITSQALAAATKYAIVIRASGGDGSNYMVWRGDATAPAYAGGARCHSDDSGGSWAEDANTDMLFREGEVI